MKFTRKTLLIPAFCLYMAPAVWLFVTAFKSRQDAVAIPPRIWFTPTWSNFRSAFATHDLLEVLGNSMLVATVSTLVSITGALMAIFAIMALKPRWRDFWLFTAASTRMIPPIVSVVPLYILMRSGGLLDSRGAVILAHGAGNLGFCIWLLSSYLSQLGPRVLEMGQMDGHTRASAFTRLVLPLSAPGVALTTAFCFLLSWNEYVFASVLGPFGARTLPVVVPGLVTHFGTYWGQVAAIGVVSAIPGVLIAVLAGPHLVRALSFGSVYEWR